MMLATALEKKDKIKEEQPKEPPKTLKKAIKEESSDEEPGILEEDSEEEIILDPLPLKDIVSFTVQEFNGRNLKPGGYQWKSIQGIQLGPKFGRKSPKKDLLPFFTVAWERGSKFSTEPQGHFFQQEALVNSTTLFLERKISKTDSKGPKHRPSKEALKKKTIKKQKNRRCIVRTCKEAVRVNTGGILFQCNCFVRDDFIVTKLYRICKKCKEKDFFVVCFLCETEREVKTELRNLF